MDQLPLSLTDFLTFIASPVFGAWVVSEILEQAQWFQLLPSGRKSMIVLVVMLLLSVTSFALVRWTPATVVEQLQPFYSVIIGTIIAFISGKVYHDKTHNPTETTSESRAVTAVIKTTTSKTPLSGDPVIGG